MGRGEMAMTAGAEARAAAEIIDRFSDEPAPFLSILHGIDERFGYLPEGALNAVAEALRIPIAELYGTVTFYHYWRLRKPAGQPPIQMCDGPACCLKGVDALEEELPRARLPAKHSGRVERIPCPGRCDIGVPLFIGQDAFAGARPGTVAEIAPATSPLPPETGLVECLFEGIRDGDRSVAGYRKRGGYEALQPAVSAPETVLAELKESGLTGRGGAGFPTWAKWDAVRREAADEKYIICNADEGEPGCFKDRLLLDHDPQAILEGMAAAGLVTGARTGIIYLRYEYGHTLGTLEHAIAEAEREGLLGEDVQGSGRAFRVVVRRGAGAYICGEETSLLSSLEGRHPFPRDKPPFPTTCGLFGMPTVINNVETFAAVPPILRRGGAWYRGLGIGDRAGTRIFSVSGDNERPGNYELPVGTPLRELLEEHAGDAPGGRGLKGVTMAGVSGGF
ncbi:MAG: NAD(P)H-dependent oxidoreductase subunit E, partial [Planctomycetota bacterium]